MNTEEVVMEFDEAVELVRLLRTSKDPAGSLCVAAEDASEVSVDFNMLSAQYPMLPNVVNMVASVVKRLMIEGPDKNRFYTALWEFLSSDSLMPTDEEKAIALLFLLDSYLIPYRQLPLLCMSEDDYKRHRDSLAFNIGVARHIMQRDFLQKTQEASAVLSIIESCESNEEKAVLMAVVLGMVREGAA